MLLNNDRPQRVLCPVLRVSLKPIKPVIHVSEQNLILYFFFVISRHGDGAYYEHGPRTLRPSGVAGANTLQLIEDIGIDVSLTLLKYLCHIWSYLYLGFALCFSHTEIPHDNDTIRR